MGPTAAEYYAGPPLDGNTAGWFNANALAYETAADLEHGDPGGARGGARPPPADRARGRTARPPDRSAAAAATPPSAKAGRSTPKPWAASSACTHDPYGRFGHLQWQAFRAARLVVDTGVHALGWTREQAIDFMIERTGVDAVQSPPRSTAITRNRARRWPT